MVSKKDLSDAALHFLHTFADIVISRHGSIPMKQQRSTWIERISPGSTSSRTHERQAVGNYTIQFLHADSSKDDFPAQEQLHNLLVTAGVDASLTYGGYFIPLILHWLGTSDPFTFEKSDISGVLNEFTNAVLNKTVVTRLRSAVVNSVIHNGPLILEKGVCIRPITEDELWEFADEYLPIKLQLYFLMVSEEWNILDIKLKHGLDEDVSATIDNIRQAVVAGLLLTNEGEFGIEDLVQETNYGLRYSGIPFKSAHMNRGQGAYVLNKEMGDSLKSAWPRLSKVTGSKAHYLRLPISRFIDSAGRNRSEDAVIDNSIGLEALLTEGVRDELRYRFALRGATIINWEGGDKQKDFKRLQEFYDVRSTIVHGAHVEEAKLTRAGRTGEEALRQVWWWFFNRNEGTLKEALAEIDKHILS